jgi:hypothetical protein
MIRQAFRDRIADCSRARNSAHIDDEANLRSSEQGDEFADRARGVTNGEERERHVCHRGFRFAPSSQPRRLNTAALCKAT